MLVRNWHFTNEILPHVEDRQATSLGRLQVIFHSMPHYYHFYGNVNLNAQPLSMQGTWDQDLAPGQVESQEIKGWSAQKVS